MKNFTVTMTDPRTNNTVTIDMVRDEEPKTAQDEAPRLRPYTVVLKASSYKEVPVKAISPDAAQELVRQMYFTGGVIDFTDEDVVSIESSVDGEDEPVEVNPELKPIIEIVKLIRNTDAPDYVLAMILDQVITETFLDNDD